MKFLKSAAWGMMVFLLASLGTEAGAAQWPDVLKQIKSKYAGFNTKIKDMEIKQKMQASTPQGSMDSEVTFMRKGDKFKTESVMHMEGMPENMGPMTTTIIYDGKDTWMISSMMGTKKLPTDAKDDQMKNEFWWEILSAQARISGSENVNGKDCYVVEVTESGNVPFTRMWIDSKKLNLVRAQSKQDGKMMTTEFSDWRPVLKKWEMPYRTEMFMDDAKVMAMTIQSVKVNKGIPDSAFSAEQAKSEGGGGMFGNMMQQMMNKGKQ